MYLDISHPFVKSFIHFVWYLRKNDDEILNQNIKPWGLILKSIASAKLPNSSTRIIINIWTVWIYEWWSKYVHFQKLMARSTKNSWDKNDKFRQVGRWVQFYRGEIEIYLWNIKAELMYFEIKQTYTHIIQLDLN